MRQRSIAAALGPLWLCFAGTAETAKTQVAVAANFTEPAREIAVRFREKTGHEAVPIFGASGAFFTRITDDAPFDYVETMQWREATVLAGGMVAFAFVVILSMILIQKRYAMAGT
jgi:ABC-type molybdate transport system substrate-binding protein